MEIYVYSKTSFLDRMNTSIESTGDSFSVTYKLSNNGAYTKVTGSDESSTTPVQFTHSGSTYRAIFRKTVECEISSQGVFMSTYSTMQVTVLNRSIVLTRQVMSSGTNYQHYLPVTTITVSPGTYTSANIFAGSLSINIVTGKIL